MQFTMSEVQRIVEAVACVETEVGSLVEASIDVLDAVRIGDERLVRQTLCDWEVIVDCVDRLERQQSFKGLQ